MAFFNDSEGRHCALGHCGEMAAHYTRESSELSDLFKNNLGVRVAYVNDCKCIDMLDLGDTPKERIMNALMLINAGVEL